MFNSMKMIKLFGWEEIFANRVRKTRDEAQEHQENQNKKGIYQMWLGKCSWFITPAIVYSLYILMGESINLSTVVVSREFFGKLNWILWVGPHAYKCFNETKSNFAKI